MTSKDIDGEQKVNDDSTGGDRSKVRLLFIPCFCHVHRSATSAREASGVPLSDGPARSTAFLSVPLAVLTAASVVGNLLSPHLLVANPLVLVMLAPRTLYLTVAAGRTPLGLFLVVGLLRLAAADPSHYLLGRLHGPRLTELARRRAGPHRAVRLLLRAWQRIGLPLVALSPTGKVLVMAGASGIRHRRVAAVALGGTLVQLLALYAAGRAVSGPTEALGSLVSEHSGVLVLVAAVATIAVAGKAVVGRSGSRQVARHDEAVAVGFQYPRGALGHRGVVAQLDAVVRVEAAEEVLDDVAVGAEHRDRACRSSGQGEDVAGRAALGQGGIDLHRQLAVAGQVDDGLQAAHVPAGQDALDGEPRQYIHQAGGLAPALPRQRPPLVGAFPLLAVARVGMPDHQERDRHVGCPGGWHRRDSDGWNDFSTRRSRS